MLPSVARNDQTRIGNAPVPIATQVHTGYCDRVAIRLEHVSKSFGAVRAVIDVTLELDAGTVSVIEGPNGSGKSTLLGLIGTLIRPTSGTIEYGDLGDTVMSVRTKLGWLGHDTLCYPDLTGRENVELAAQFRGLDGKEAWRDAVQRFGVGELHARPVRVASRGQKQRIALARALIGKPPVLLLDEPSTGLDRMSVERIAEVVMEEARRGAAVVIVTHDRSLLESVKCKKFQMDRGRIKSTTS